MASPQVMKKLRSFADKISGVSYVDNTTDPTSARGMLNRKNANLASPKAKPGIVGKNSNGIGVGN